MLLDLLSDGSKEGLVVLAFGVEFREGVDVCLVLFCYHNVGALDLFHFGVEV
jgi:hypothetical protein